MHEEIILIRILHIVNRYTFWSTFSNIRNYCNCLLAWLIIISKNALLRLLPSRDHSLSPHSSHPLGCLSPLHPTASPFQVSFLCPFFNLFLSWPFCFSWNSRGLWQKQIKHSLKCCNEDTITTHEPQRNSQNKSMWWISGLVNWPFH